jgi:hypothetical protein
VSSLRSDVEVSLSHTVSSCLSWVMLQVMSIHSPGKGFTQLLSLERSPERLSMRCSRNGTSLSPHVARIVSLSVSSLTVSVSLSLDLSLLLSQTCVAMTPLDINSLLPILLLGLFILLPSSSMLLLLSAQDEGSLFSISSVRS